jgi:predicted porin
VCVAFGTNAARADASTDAQIKALQGQVEALMKTVKELKDAQAHTAAESKSAKQQAKQAETTSAQAKATATEAQAKAPPKAASFVGNVDSEGHYFLERKPGKTLTFYTFDGEITAYGQFDVSFDGATKNAKSGPVREPQGDSPVGNFGWMPDISTNISYLGVRGFQRLPYQAWNSNWNFVYQFEAGIDISALPGIRQTNSNLSNQVNGALFSRNSYIGLESKDWGAVKIGKTDAPYKNSTAQFNPFSGMWGDYSVVMGNTGGDNRVEFGTRLAHAIWYESPKLNGWQFNFLFAPGQNRADDNSNLASGESDCAGGNDPSSGANPLITCSDGSFGNAYSANISYTNGPFYITAAWEQHDGVNRQSDLAGAYGILPTFNPTVGQNCSAFLAAGNNGAISQQQCLDDVANEDAYKVGALYTFPTKTTIGGIVEYMHRAVPDDISFQNERTRWGTWAFLSQELTPLDSIHFGWAHAFHTPGDPGQHNSSTLVTDNGASYGPNQNQADMVTAAWKHKFSDNLIWYTDVAATFNGPSAHYDLGAGGRSVTTDCHDANATPGGLTANPQCWTGTTLVGVSTGLQWKF